MHTFQVLYAESITLRAAVSLHFRQIHSAVLAAMVFYDED